MEETFGIAILPFVAPKLLVACNSRGGRPSLEGRVWRRVWRTTAHRCVWHQRRDLVCLRSIRIAAGHPTGYGDGELTRAKADSVDVVRARRHSDVTRSAQVRQRISGRRGDRSPARPSEARRSVEPSTLSDDPSRGIGFCTALSKRATIWRGFLPA